MDTAVRSRNDVAIYRVEVLSRSKSADFRRIAILLPGVLQFLNGRIAVGVLPGKGLWLRGRKAHEIITASTDNGRVGRFRK